MKRLMFITALCAFMAGPVLADLMVSVPAESLLSFAGQTQASLESSYPPSSGWASVPWDVGGAGSCSNFHNDTADWEGVVRNYSTIAKTTAARTAASVIPPFVDVSGWEAAGTKLSISATGTWGRGPSYSYGPDGHGSNTNPGAEGHGEYDDLGIAWVHAPKASLIGVFLTDSAPSGSAPAVLTAGVSDMTTPLLQQSFLIGSSLNNITIPTGATRLFLGFHNGHEWWNNDGDMEVTVVPVPGAVILGLLGLTAAGVKLRRFA
jgi:hypothetical protein